MQSSCACVQPYEADANAHTSITELLGLGERLRIPRLICSSPSMQCWLDCKTQRSLSALHLLAAICAGYGLLLHVSHKVRPLLLHSAGDTSTLHIVHPALLVAKANTWARILGRKHRCHWRCRTERRFARAVQGHWVSCVSAKDPGCGLGAQRALSVDCSLWQCHSGANRRTINTMWIFARQQRQAHAWYQCVTTMCIG